MNKAKTHKSHHRTASADTKSASPFFSKSISPNTATLSGVSIQPKIAVGKADSKFEHQADQIADEVVHDGGSRGGSIPSRILPVTRSEFQGCQRQMAEKDIPSMEKEDHDAVQTKSLRNQTKRKEPLEEEADEETAQTKSRGNNGPLMTESLQDQIRSLKGKGRPLNQSERRFFEPRFQSDFSQVRLHTNHMAAEASRGLNARAFTVGNDIALGDGQFAPDTTSGRHLLAHELTHILQQQPRNAIKPDSPSEANVTDEREISTPSETSLSQTPKASKDIDTFPSKTSEAPNIESNPFSQTRLQENASATNIPTGDSPELSDSAITEDLSLKDSAGVDQGLKENKPISTSPKDDPEFIKTIKYTERVRTVQKDHQELEVTEAKTINAGLIEPEKQKDSTVKKSQIELLGKDAEPHPPKIGKITPESFKSLLNSKIEKLANSLPEDRSKMKSLKGETFVEKGLSSINDGVATVSSTVTQPLSDEFGKTHVSVNNSIKTPEQLTREVAPKKPRPINKKAAAPKPKLDSEISMEKERQSFDDLMSKNQLTDEQLIEKNSNEPKFYKALTANREAQIKAIEAPKRYRMEEKIKIDLAQADARNTGRKGIQGMVGKNTKALDEVFEKQGGTAKKDNKEQEDFYKKQLKIHRDTKADVELYFHLLSEIDIFEFGRRLELNTRNFINNVTTKANDVASILKSSSQEEREYEKIFIEEKAEFLRWAEESFEIVAKRVSEVLNEAIARIALGKKNAEDAFAALTTKQQSLNGEAYDFFIDQYGDLEKTVHNTQHTLAQSLAESYQSSVTSLDESYEKIKEEAQKSILDKAVEFVEEVADVIAGLRNLLSTVFSRLKNIIGKIIDHPIRFLKNLGKGVKKGVDSFFSNIDDHLREGFFAWLSGTMSGTNVSLPKKFDAKSIFVLTTQIMDVGFNKFKKLAASIWGKKEVKAIEKGAELGGKGLKLYQQILKTKSLGGLWGQIKEMVTGKVKKIIKEIKEFFFNTVIKKVITHIAKLVNPVGAFIKAVELVYAAFRFLADNMERIAGLVNSFLDSVEMAVNGNESGIISAIVKGLKTSVVLAIDLLAKVLGLGNLKNTIKKFLKKLREPIEGAMRWVLRKTKPLIDRIFKAGKKVAAKVKKKAKDLKGKLVLWWKAKKGFTADNGESHTLLFKGKKNNAKLVMRSKETPFSTYLDSLNQEDLNTKGKKEAFSSAKSIALQIESIKGTPLKGDGKEEKKVASKERKDKIQGLLNDLSVQAALLIDHDIPDWKEPSYGGLKEGLGTSMHIRTLTNKGSGFEGGSPPTSSSPSVYEDLNLRRLPGGSNYYVKGHLLNDNLGGPGKWFNMTPLSVQGNKNHLQDIEKDLKDKVYLAKIFDYKVTPEYNPRGGSAKKELKNKLTKGVSEVQKTAFEKIIEAEDFVPKQLNIEVKELEPKGKGFTEKSSKAFPIANPIDQGGYHLSGSSVPKVESVNINSISSPDGLTAKVVGEHKNSDTFKSMEKHKNSIFKAVDMKRADTEQGFGTYSKLVEAVKKDDKSFDLATVNDWREAGFVKLGGSK